MEQGESDESCSSAESASSTPIHCIFCCATCGLQQNLELGNAGESNNQKNVEQLGQFIKDMELDFDSNVISNLATSVCQNCFKTLEEIVESKGAADLVEEKVRNLQNEILGMMRKLDSSLEKFHTQLKWMDVQMKKGDEAEGACLTTCVNSVRCSADAIVLRNRVVDVIQKLTLYRTDLQTKVIKGVNSENVTKSLKLKENAEPSSSGTNEQRISKLVQTTTCTEKKEEDDDHQQGEIIISEGNVVMEITAPLLASSPALSEPEKSSVTSRSVALAIPVVPGLKGIKGKSDEMPKSSGENAIKQDDGYKKNKLKPETGPPLKLGSPEESQKSTASSRGVQRNQKRKCRSFKCNECQLQCKSLQDLKTHEMTHLTKREFECPIKSCTKVYTKLIHLQRHFKQHPSHERKSKDNNKSLVLKEQKQNKRSLRSSRVASSSPSSSSDDESLFVQVTAGSVDNPDQDDKRDVNDDRQVRELNLTDPKLKMKINVLLSPYKLTKSLLARKSECKPLEDTTCTPEKNLEASGVSSKRQSNGNKPEKVVYFGDTDDSSSGTESEDESSDDEGISFSARVSKWKQRIIRGLFGKQKYKEREMLKKDPTWKPKYSLNYVSERDKLTFGRVTILFEEDDDKRLACGYSRKKCDFRTSHIESQFFETITSHIAQVHLQDNSESRSTCSTTTFKSKRNAKWNPNWDEDQSDFDEEDEQDEEEELDLTKSENSKAVRQRQLRKRKAKGRAGRRKKGKRNVPAKAQICENQQDDNKSNSNSMEQLSAPNIIGLEEVDVDKRELDEITQNDDSRSMSVNTVILVKSQLDSGKRKPKKIGMAANGSKSAESPCKTDDFSLAKKDQIKIRLMDGKNTQGLKIKENTSSSSDSDEEDAENLLDI